RRCRETRDRSADTRVRRVDTRGRRADTCARTTGSRTTKDDTRTWTAGTGSGKQLTGTAHEQSAGMAHPQHRLAAFAIAEVGRTGPAALVVRVDQLQRTDFRAEQR